jgi:hypothetical protein
MSKSQQAKDALTGGRTVSVKLRNGSTETVFVREATVREIIDDSYFDNLKNDPIRLVAIMCDRPLSWVESLPRSSWTELRKAEEELNFDFALAEMQAALDRGQRMKVIDDEAENLARRILQLHSAMFTPPVQNSLPDISRPLEPEEAKRYAKRSAG